MALRSSRLGRVSEASQAVAVVIPAKDEAERVAATVAAAARLPHVDLVVVTSLPSAVLRQRLGLLAGSGWQLRDVTAA